MKRKLKLIHDAVRTGAYIYLALPVVLFFLGWCRWYIGIPAALIVIYAVMLCRKEWQADRKEKKVLCGAGAGKKQAVPYDGAADRKKQVGSYSAADRRKETAPCGDTGKNGAAVPGRIPAGWWLKAAAVVVLVLAWVWMSGVGGYVWQNSDHPIRSRIFVQLVEERWPVVKVSDSLAEPRGLVYYLGYWLVPAAAGKLFGTRAGWAVQYLWAAAGILLVYALISIRRKKLSVWPLVLIIFFSGLDAAGMLLREPENFRIIGTLSLDEWFGYYQFSSMTTQLFWVFNQAVPAWVLCALVFLGEKPRNMPFLASLAILTSTFPFAGILPFVLYFMVTRSAWSADRGMGRMLTECGKNWGSLQNIAGGGTVAVICVSYIAGNDSVRGSLRALGTARGMMVTAAGAVLAAVVVWMAAWLAVRGWGRFLKIPALVSGVIFVFARIHAISGELSPLRYWIYLVVFYVLEAGMLLAVLYPYVEDKRLFILNAAWLYIIPLILVGKANDFCMRASIPGLFLLMLWCIRMLDTCRKKISVCMLVLLLAGGALTPVHEMARTLVSTWGGFENQTAAEESIFTGSNFSGSIQGIFWEYIAEYRAE